MVLLSFALGEYQVKNGKQCYECSGGNNKVCRDPLDPNIKHCCGEFEYSLNCGNWNNTQCSDQIAEGIFIANSLLLCDTFNACELDKLWPLKGYSKHYAGENFTLSEPCIITLHNSADKDAQINFEDLRSKGIYGYLFSQENSKPTEFYIRHFIGFREDQDSNITVRGDRALYLVIEPSSKENYLSFQYTLIESGGPSKVLIICLSLGAALLCAGFIALAMCFIKRRKQKNRHRKLDDEQLQHPIDTSAEETYHSNYTPASQYTGAQSERKLDSHETSYSQTTIQNLDGNQPLLHGSYAAYPSKAAPVPSGSHLCEGSAGRA
ncbi:unnamed protein product [Moneuplotes crassus]|uniref:Uncharacterized protein n=1 Tax=Euplotes crassus TaxID=5936 RepID=A0AAD1XFQ9_EUPCR|nr:unnamed protein product [Moneuplotes crassus]